MTGILESAIIFYTIAVVGLAIQIINNQFVAKDPNAQARRAANQFLKEEEEKRKREPNKAPVPLPPNKKQKPDDKVDKKIDHDPIVNKKPNGNPDPIPNNDDAPKVNFKRIIPPKPTPTPPPNPTPNPTPTPLPYPINVKKPPLFERVGRFIYQPIEDVELTYNSMPIDGNNKSNWQPLFTEQQTVNQTQNYINFLSDSRLGKPIGKYKISDLIPVFMSPTGNVDANLSLMVGTETIGKMIEAYENYSDGFLSNPLFFIPTKININQINGNTNKKRRYGDEIDTNFKPVNEATPQLILEQNLFNIPKEVTIEQVLQFAGYAATFEGGAEKWEQYKKDPKIIKDPTFYDRWKIPTTDQILNETVEPDQPKYQKQNLKIDSATELLLVTAGVLYTKTGLHEFPSETLPGVKNPFPMPEGETNQNTKSNAGVRIGSLAGAMAYLGNWFNFKIGDFPAEVVVPDTSSPDPKATKKETVDVSGALTNLLTMGGIGLALGNFNKDINLRNAGEIEAAKNAAKKSAECSCINMANNGFNTRPKAQCSQGAMNFTSAKGFTEMLTNTQRCYQGNENADPATLKSMIENLMFGVNIIKSSLFRGEKELENQEKVLKDLLKGKLSEKELEDFIKKFNSQQTPITKDYPIKAKIVKKSQGGNP